MLERKDDSHLLDSDTAGIMMMYLNIIDFFNYSRASKTTQQHFKNFLHNKNIEVFNLLYQLALIPTKQKKLNDIIQDISIACDAEEEKREAKSLIGVKAENCLKKYFKSIILGAPAYIPGAICVSIYGPSCTPSAINAGNVCNNNAFVFGAMFCTIGAITSAISCAASFVNPTCSMFAPQVNDTLFEDKHCFLRSTPTYKAVRVEFNNTISRNTTIKKIVKNLVNKNRQLDIDYQRIEKDIEKIVKENPALSKKYPGLFANTNKESKEENEFEILLDDDVIITINPPR